MDDANEKVLKSKLLESKLAAEQAAANADIIYKMRESKGKSLQRENKEAAEKTIHENNAMNNAVRYAAEEEAQNKACVSVLFSSRARIP